MLSFLSRQSLQLLQGILPFALDISANRIANFLSFYLSHTSKHLYHCPNILSHSTLQDFFQQIQAELIDTPQNMSAQHLFAKVFLSLHFQEHVMDEKGAFRFYSGLRRLHSLKKQDMIEQFLKSRCSVSSSSGKIIPKTKLNPLHKRTLYISYNRQLPDPTSLSQLITLNPLYQLQNLNKILIFGQSSQSNFHLPSSLQQFCNEYSINLKLLKNNTAAGVLEYVYLRSKRNILVHETIHNQHQIYDLRTPEEKIKKVDGKVINPLVQKFMPQEIAVFTQRLPKSSVVVDNKEQVLQKMRTLLGLERGDNLVDPAKTLPFSVLQKNYRHEDEEDEPDQSRLGFLTRRLASLKNYELNRAEEHVPYSPYHKRRTPQ